MIKPSDILQASILIVDDQAANVALLEQLLRGAGYLAVTSTRDPHAVCDLHRQHRYSLILLDLEMPGLDGFQVMEGLKAIETSGYLPVLVLTAQPAHKLRALKAGARDFVSKPFDLAEVLMRVQNLLEVRLLHAEAELRTQQAEKNELAMRASEVSYRRLFEAARDGILILDVQTGRINDVNPFLVELLGFSHAEMVGKTVGELSPFKDIEENQLMLERLQKNGYVRYDDLPLETRDGRHIAVEFVSNVYQAGDCTVIQCNVRDITQRKQTENAQRASEARYRTLFEYAPDGIVIADSASYYLDANASMCRMLGYTRAELVGMHASDIVVPSEVQHIGPALDEIKVRADYHREWQFQRKDDSAFPAEVMVTTMPDGNLMAVIHDVTERKQIEAQIQGLNADLERRVAERTAQLHTVNQELEAFSYSVSHDLRAPLRHVLGFVALLQKDAGPTLSEKSLGRLTTISGAAKRMGQLIDDLLAFSRVGRSAMQKTEVNLGDLVRETAGDFQAETVARNIRWEVGPLPTVRADRALLRMALVNLLANAVKFTGARPEAKIEIGRLPGDQDEEVIFIRDNGAGFDAQYSDKLFGVFQRLHSQSEFEGTGIGLANVQRIIQRHGGRVWAEGVVDAGATFYFSIPKPNKA
jgi:PAS domain S-box-containing protein